MPSNRNLKSDDVDGFMLAVWDSIVDLQQDYGISVAITIHPMLTRGHIVYRAVARDAGGEADDAVVATAEAVWPTHYAKTQHALLYALLVRLWRELDAHVQEKASGYGQPGGDQPAKGN